MILEFTAGEQAAISTPIIFAANGTTPQTGLTEADFAVDFYDGLGELFYSCDVDDEAPDTNDTDKATVEFAELGTGVYQWRVTFETAAVGLLGHATIQCRSTYGMVVIDYDLRVYAGAVQVGASATTYLNGLRYRGVAVGDLSDANANYLISEALFEYSRMRPIMADRTFETVADQQKYTPTEMGDSSILRVTFCIWNPYQTGDEWDYARFAALGIPRDPGYYHMPSQEMLEQIKAAAWAKNYGGTGRQELSAVGGDLYLAPCPDDDGEIVYIQYTKRHTSTTTIPDADRDIFLDLLHSMAAERIAMELSNKAAIGGRVKTPEYEIETAAKIKTWRVVAEQKRQSFIDKCNAGYAACGRS